MALKCCEWMRRREAIERLIYKRREIPLSLWMKLNIQIRFLFSRLEPFSSFPQA
jgi:hypothetical protein